MMTDDLLQLITASIDGELTAAESRRLRRLLDSSPEAAQVHARLLADSQKLHALPRVAPPADLQSRVMARIAALTPVPSRLAKLQPRTQLQPHAEPARRATPFSRKSRQWAPVAVAASLLIGVTASSFLFFNQQNQNVRSSAARNANRPPLGTHKGAEDPAWAKWLPAESGPRPSAPEVRERPPVSETYVARHDFPVVRQPVDTVALAPEPRSARPDVFGGHLLPDTRFEQVEIRLPFLKPLSDFDREDTRQQLTDELAKDPAFRIDLFTRNPARAIELFGEAARATGVSLQADKNTVSQIQKRTANAAVIYTESLTAQELTDLFARLSSEDVKVSPNVFDILHATPLADTDAKDLRTVLGFDPGLFKRSVFEKSSDKRPDPNKPLSAGTADQIVKSVTTGQGKPGEKPAVLLTWNLIPGRALPQANSPELKQFLSKRGDRKANAVPVIIVIRPTNG